MKTPKYLGGFLFYYVYLFMHFFLIIFLFIPFFLLSQDRGDRGINNGQQTLIYSDERFKLKYKPRTDILIDGNIFKNENLKGFIFTKITHHNLLSGKFRKLVNKFFTNSVFEVNKKKWKKGDGYLNDYVYIEYESKYINAESSSDFISIWNFKDHQLNTIMSLRVVNKKYDVLLKELVSRDLGFKKFYNIKEPKK